MSKPQSLTYLAQRILKEMLQLVYNEQRDVLNSVLNQQLIYNLNCLRGMSVQKEITKQSRSRQTTQEDSSSDRDQEIFCRRTNPAKHKTELCKTYSQLGQCPYQHKCRFAHGKHELISLSIKTQSKNRKCNGFWKNGCCSYGIRCQFGHSQFKWQDLAILSGLQAVHNHLLVKKSKLMRLLQ